MTQYAPAPGGVPARAAQPLAPRGRWPARWRGYWLAPSGLVMLAATALALGIRLFLLSRTGYLTGITEYDDGVYLGGAIRLLSGAVPYRDFAFVQPPGILLLMTPAALAAKVTSASTGMAAARLLTVAASAGCVTLAGALARHRGPRAVAVCCGLLAVYPDDIQTAHTLLLEPWMNLLVLAGTCLAFRAGQLAGPRRLLGAGTLLGLAATVKYWAALPALALLLACLIPAATADGRGRDPAAEGPLRPPSPARTRRAAAVAVGALAGFIIPAAPFALAGPGLFIRSTVLDQASRTGSAVPVTLRLAHLTGLSMLLDAAGQLTVTAGRSSLFALNDVTASATGATGWLPALVAAVLAALLLLGYGAGWRAGRPGPSHPAAIAGPGSAGGGRGPCPLDWYALAMLAGSTAAVLGYSAFFYHYPDFVAPWLALAAGYAVAALLDAARTARTRPEGSPPGNRPARGRPPGSTRLAAGLAAALIAVALLEASQLSGLHAADVAPNAALIPAGSCVVTDEISLAIAADRFTAGSHGCPDILDSLATTLVSANGISVQGGAQALPRVVASWRAAFGRADYVWLSATSDRRIPWTTGLRVWFGRHFRPLRAPPGEFREGTVYARRS